MSEKISLDSSDSKTQLRFLVRNNESEYREEQ